MSSVQATYSDQLMGWLKEEGYTDCFFVGGGNSMYLLEAASKVMNCHAVVHEVSAVIAAEYFNEVSGAKKKAFALVTAGPGLTNAVTGIAGAWLENRGVLILGGQVKVSDLMNPGMRQRGIQELDGVKLVSSITKKAIRVDKQIRKSTITQAIREVFEGRPGPVFIEVCIDVSAKPLIAELDDSSAPKFNNKKSGFSNKRRIQKTRKLLLESKRPIFLFGNGVNRVISRQVLVSLEKLKIPAASTWTGADRAPSTYAFYAGRPNLFGMRWANLIQQQADLIIAVGTRLSLQQTGFNWEAYAPLAKIVHVDIDKFELNKGHPITHLRIQSDSEYFLRQLLENIEEDANKSPEFKERMLTWSSFVQEVRNFLPLIETTERESNFINPHQLIFDVTHSACDPSDIIVSCSSGGTFTAALQTAFVHQGQMMLSNKGLASMGYGLAGAIGSSFAEPRKRVILFEGDGGFAQNLQELSTVALHNLNLKVFIFDNNGYASIKSTQKRLLSGNFLGCDPSSGLGLPDWQPLVESFGIRVVQLNPANPLNDIFFEHFNSAGPVCFVVKCNPDYEYLPKVMSKIDSNGNITSDPIHEMWPYLEGEARSKVFKFFN